MRNLSLSMMLVVFIGALSAHADTVRLETLPIPGDAAFVRQAREVMDVVFTIDPSQASGGGLFDDADRVPSYRPQAVAQLEQRLNVSLQALRALPWRSWNVDAQIDFRWVYANAALAQRELSVERIYTRRPGAWLEPTANNLINLVTYAPQRLDLQAEVLDKVPAMLVEMREIVTQPTERDVFVAQGLLRGLQAMCQAPIDEKTRQSNGAQVQRLLDARARAGRALAEYRSFLATLRSLPRYRMIGAENYAWRFRHAMLLPWSPLELLAMARHEERMVGPKMKHLLGFPTVAGGPLHEPTAPTALEQRMAKYLTASRLLALYDAVMVAERAAVVRSGMVTIPPGVGPIHARQTPEAMVALTGDGGSMNPPPPYVPDNTGYWNVEHFHANWPYAVRLQAVRSALEFRTDGMGPYAAHEGVPGHHLQLSIARLNPDPIRNLLSDAVENEGWALYAEEAFWRAGGLGPSKAARYNVLKSYLHRIHRVIYDVNLETNRWTLQHAADYKHDAPPGKGRIDEELMRSLNWPTQLVCYFAGKMQILQLQRDYRRKMGSAYSDRAFHDALLSLGSVPFVFARSKLLGEPVPDL